MFRFFYLLLLLFCLRPLGAQAEIWASFSAPSSFGYSVASSNSYQFDKSAAVKASGWTFLTKLPLLPPLGMSQILIDAPPLDTSIETANQFKLTSYDVGWDLSPKAFKFLLGYGVGKMDFNCTQTDCTTYQFKPLELHQYFTQIGVPFGTASDFHFDMRRVIGRVQVTQTTQTDIMHLQGLLASFGFRLGF